LKAKRKQQLDLIEESLSWPLFKIVFLKPGEHFRHKSGAVAEREVVCKHQVVPDSLEDTIAVQILQSPPEHRPIEYFLTPLQSSGYLLQMEKAQIDLARAEAVEQSENELGISIKKETQIQEASRRILARIRREVDAA
jgi:hypothetical protein